MLNVNVTQKTKLVKPQLNVSQIRKYFILLGYKIDEPVVLRALPGKGYNKNNGGSKYKPTTVDYLPETELQKLAQHNTPYSLYAVVNGGGHTDVEVTEGKAFFFEWDDISKDEQWSRVKALGLQPYITFTVETRKSIHFYIVLDKPCTVDQWRSLQVDLLVFTDSDQALKNPSRIMRPAGTLHIQKDSEPFLCSINHESGVNTSYEILRSVIPNSTPKTKQRKANNKCSSTGTTLEALTQKVQQYQYKKQLKPAQVQKLLKDAQEKLANTEQGGRNAAIFSIGCELGRKTLLGVPVQDAYAAICAGAAASGLEADEYESTALRALDTGANNAIDSHPDQVSDELAKSFIIEDPDQVIHQRFIGELPFNGKQHLILKSQKGTGKTTALLSLMEQLSKQNIKALLIGHRCVLLNQSSHNLNLSYYGDVVGKLDSQSNLAITLDSLHLINPSVWKGCVVLLDEASQVLRHLTGDTAVKQTRRACLDTLRFLIAHSTHTIMLDADMSSVEVDFLSRVVPRESVNVVVNTQLPTQRQFSQHNSQESLVNYVIEQLKQGKNVYIPSNSKEVVEVVASTISQLLPDISSKTITSKNSDTAEIQLFVRDINNQVKDVQVLLASPSLGTGVDINVSHFDVVCAFITNGSQCSANDVMQHIARVRNINSNEVHIWVRGGINQVETNADQLALEVQYATQPDLYYINKATGKREPVDTELHNLYVWLYCSVTARHNASVCNLERSLLKLIKDECHIINSYLANDAEAISQTKAQLKQTKQQLKKEGIAAIVKAQNITQKQVEQLADEKHLTPEQQASIEKYYIHRDCGVDTITKDLVEWYKDKGRRGIRNYIDTYIKPVGLLSERDARDKMDTGTFSPDQRKQTAVCELRRKLIPQDILNGSEFTHDSLHATGWIALVQENAEAIKALLGITFNAAKPVQAMTSMLEQLGMDVDSKKTSSRRRADTVSTPLIYVVAFSALQNPQTQQRRYSITPGSLERMAGIVERTKYQLAWFWYESVRDNIHRLSHQQDTTTSVAVRISNLKAVLSELEPLVKQKLEEEENWFS